MRVFNAQKILSWKEVKITLKLAFPMVIAQLVTHSLHILDSAMIGRIGVLPLAGASFASNFVGPFMMFGFGFALAVSVMVAKVIGKGDTIKAKTILTIGFWVSVIASIGLALSVVLASFFADGLRQPQSVLEIGMPYLYWLAFSLIPLLIFSTLRSYCEASGKPWIAVVILLITLVINFFLNGCLIYGWAGFPRLELIGAGIATVLSRIIGLGLILIYLVRSSSFISRRDLFSRFTWNYSLFRSYLAIAFPSGFQITFNATLFIAATFLMGWISAVAIVAHSIAIHLTAITFMIPLGISFAVGIRVAHAWGEQDKTKIHRIVCSTSTFTFFWMIGAVILILSLKHFIPLWFIEPSDPLAQSVLTLTSSLLVIVAFFSIFDGLNIVLLGALRGLQDVRYPLTLIFICYWIVAFPMALFFGFEHSGWGLGLGSKGIWLAFLLSMILSVTTMWIRYQRVQNNIFA